MRLKEGPNEEAASTLAQFIANKSSAPATNQGLPCAYCGEVQERFSVNRDGEHFFVRIAVRASRKEMSDIRKILKMFEE